MNEREWWLSERRGSIVCSRATGVQTIPPHGGIVVDPAQENRRRVACRVLLVYSMEVELMFIPTADVVQRLFFRTRKGAVYGIACSAAGRCLQTHQTVFAFFGRRGTSRDFAPPKTQTFTALRFTST
jgi:hypothetical protein